MRVGLPDYHVMTSLWQDTWRLIESDLCEPIQWIPTDIWKDDNITDYMLALANSEHVDVLADPWIVNGHFF